MTKTSVCPTPNFRNYISSWFFFNFFNILIFGVVSGEKRQKMSQNDKQFCLSPSISQEPCITRSSFLIHKCKMIISLGFFFSFFFLILILGLLGGSQGKKWSKITKTSIHRFFYLKNYPSHSLNLWYACAKGQRAQEFFIFLPNFNCLGCHLG